MSAGNKIEMQDILKTYEITLAKCGWLELIWITSPIKHKHYEIRSNGELIYQTSFLTQAMQRYNDIVQ